MGWGREACFSVCQSPQHSLCILAILLFISPAWSPVVFPGLHQLPQLKGRVTENLSPDSLRTFPGTYTPISGFLGQLQLSNSLWTLFVPWFQMFMAKLNSAFRRSAISVTDKRVQTMNEFLTCIKLIKMYAWEKSFTNTIQGKMCGCLKNHLPCRMCSYKGFLRFLGPGIPEGGLWGTPWAAFQAF